MSYRTPINNRVNFVARADNNYVGSRIDVTIESGYWKISHDDILHWVKLAGEAVATYYGKYPVPHLTLKIAPFDGNGVRHGMTWGRDGGGLIKIGLGTKTPPADLND